MKDISQNNRMFELLHVTTHMLSYLTEYEFKLTCLLFSLFVYEPNENIFIYLEEIKSGIDFFTDSGKRIVFTEGIKISRKKIRKLIYQLQDKNLLHIEEVAEGLFKITKGSLRQDCFSEQLNSPASSD